MVDRWALTTEEHALVLRKHRATRLTYAYFLVYFREYGKFPRNTIEVDEQLIVVLCKQLGWPGVDANSVFQISDRTSERLRTEIRAHFGFREATVADANMLEKWLQVHVAPNACGEIDAMLDRLLTHCKTLRIEPPTPERAERIAKAALSAYEERFYAEIFAKLTETTRTKLDSLLKSENLADDSDISKSDAIQTSNSAPAILLKLCSNSGRPSLASMQEELDKLILIRQIDLPENLFGNVATRELERYRRRVVVQEPHELRRLAKATRMTWLAAFFYLRGRSLTDDLVDTLIETIHRIGARAERKVEKELLDDLKRVSGKQNILFEMADASLSNPDGVVRDVVFPVVGEQKLRDLVKEWKATGPTYRLTLRTVIRNSYQGHYRRMVPKLLQALEFRSNNKHHQPVMDALDLVKQYADSKVHIYPPETDVPFDGVVNELWRDAVVEKDAKDRNRINRVTYEIAVLTALRERLRCKEIWVIGANRYRNPDEDLPQDFEQNREEYYAALDLPQDVDQFIADLQAEMREALDTLNTGIISSLNVGLSSKNGGWITLSPLEALPDPPTLTALKAELNAMWPMTNLLDMVKRLIYDWALPMY